MKLIVSSIRLSLVLMVVCGLLYNLVVTGIAQAVMPHQADGSLVYDENQNVIGSELIGQHFVDPKYFQSRVSSIGYNGAGSGSGNYAPSHPDLLARVQKSLESWKKENPDVPVSRLPIDLITNSGSGLDPHISPEAAEAQIPRISKLTGISAEKLQELVKDHTAARELGFLGEPVVLVLQLNLALAELTK
ncbi:K+-transporting ATPase, C subunit [Paenibacillus mucilaginosus 3016]|uniref:Potassium-transporting ATPase KdpC subunit n=1 Tax=Paenibacillus mucilaginosus 3016 TaxID=1116391 RepID=H6NGX9_9BACL|nr:potassium-transporting ATPase subunit KdpC [Paenibacillus mucilaginosus]AFC28421.1 K+-transporting ATPase, C subunit [Paenibacillus mucilaginosus 3016]WFA17218.1 potassium-transporting ATPase subunit KdpC [Paenibacillus mucilaginosus]